MCRSDESDTKKTPAGTAGSVWLAPHSASCWHYTPVQAPFRTGSANNVSVSPHNHPVAATACSWCPPLTSQVRTGNGVTHRLPTLQVSCRETRQTPPGLRFLQEGDQQTACPVSDKHHAVSSAKSMNQYRHAGLCRHQ